MVILFEDRICHGMKYFDKTKDILKKLTEENEPNHFFFKIIVWEQNEIFYKNVEAEISSEPNPRPTAPQVISSSMVKLNSNFSYCTINDSILNICIIIKYVFPMF